MTDEDARRAHGAPWVPAAGAVMGGRGPNEPASTRGEHGGHLATFLRRFGALLLVAAASTFMLQRWDHGNDVLRYYLLLGLSGLLTLCAFVCGLRVGESRGARTFLALVLGTAVVHFAVLGGLVYSQFHLSGLPAELPSYANWVAPTPASAVLTATVGAACLVPMVSVSMLALVRPVFRRYTFIFLLANALLLLPLRQVNLIGFIVLATLMVLGKIDLANRAKSALRTFEGRLVRALSFAPALVMTGRALTLYEPSSLFVGTLTMGASFLVFANAKRLVERHSLVVVLQAVSAAGVWIGWSFVLAWLEARVRLPHGVATFVYLMPYPVALGAMSFGMKRGGRVFRRVALGLSALVVNLNLLVAQSAVAKGPWTVLATLLCLVVGVIVLSWGSLSKSKVAIATGAATTLFGLGYHMWLAISVGALYNWGSLALLGITLIFVAAYLEKHRERLEIAVAGLRERLAQRA